MGKISIDLNSLKAAGVYTLEVDNTQRTSVTVNNALRMIVGFDNKGTFNRPVLLQQDTDRLAIFGDVDTKLEHKGCFFNRMLRTLLTDGPVIALNLLKVDEKYSGPDQVNYTALSLNSAKENPALTQCNEKYAQYDYLGDTLDKIIYGTTKGSNIPFVGTTPYSSLYNRSRFWVPDKDLLLAAAAKGLKIGESSTSNTYETANLLSFANVGTEEMSILAYKAGNIAGYDVTAESWYGGKENIPFGWIRPYDFISDYFIQVICVKGNWTNYPVLSTDPIWGAYFDNKGIIKDKLNSFLTADGITVIGNWSGIIIPDFIDKQGNVLSLEKKINAVTEKTGLLMSLNENALDLLTYDYSGKDSESKDPDKGCWGLDIDGNSEIEGSEVEAPFIVDMVGHELFKEKESIVVEYEKIEITDPSMNNEKHLLNGSYIHGKRGTKPVTTKLTHDIILLKADASASALDVSLDSSSKDTTKIMPGIFVPRQSDYIDTSLLDSSLEYTKDNIKSIIKRNYDILGQTATLMSKEVPAELVEVISCTDASTIGASAEVKIIYGEQPSKLKLTMSLVLDSSKYYISSANATELWTKKVSDASDNEEEKEKPVEGINFLSYNYIYDENTDKAAKIKVKQEIKNAKYFCDASLWIEKSPVSTDVKNMIIIKTTDASLTDNDHIKVGDYLFNITYNNKAGETAEYKLIPGLARVTKKQFVNVSKNADGILCANYKGTNYPITGEETDYQESYKGSKQYGFYLITATSPVLIDNGKITRQLPLSDNKISESLRFIPMKGLQITSRHRPGYDENGNLDIEKGIEKIYSVLEEEGINRGLMNSEMVNYRYIIDSMSYGLRNEMGGKVILSRVAKARKKCTAIENLPSAKQFAVSCNPYFCDTYIPGVNTRPGLNTKYIPEGGNTEMGATSVFSLPSYENGASFTACFWPDLIYTENGKALSVPPAADVANVLNRKFNGLNDSYCICANTNGILSNKYLTGLEFLADVTDREYLEPFGVNTIIKEGKNIMIYGNQTAYQSVKSDLNKLHVRENLNTAEIECEAVLKRFNFLYNTPAVRANVVSQITPILQAMQTSGALAQYEIICDETNNTQDVIEADACIVEIGLWFNHGMEKIVQQFTINRQTATID